MDIVKLLIDLIFQPGSSLWLVPAINITILLLLVVLLVTLVYSDVAKIHIIVMSFLSVGLFLSVNWFYYEYNKAIKEKSDGKAIEDTDNKPVNNKKIKNKERSD